MAVFTLCAIHDTLITRKHPVLDSLIHVPCDAGEEIETFLRAPSYEVLDFRNSRFRDDHESDCDRVELSGPHHGRRVTGGLEVQIDLELGIGAPGGLEFDDLIVSEKVDKAFEFDTVVDGNTERLLD